MILHNMKYHNISHDQWSIQKGHCEKKKNKVLVFSKLNLKFNILFVSFLRYLDTRQCFEIEINEKKPPHNLSFSEIFLTSTP